MPTSVQPPATVVNNSSIGNAIWDNVNNVKVEDGANATVLLEEVLGAPSFYLWCTGFFTSLSSSITPLGLSLRIKGIAVGDVASYSTVKMIKGGAIVGSNKGGAFVPTSLSFTPFGGSSDLWGTTLTGAQATASDFGIGISAEIVDTGSVTVGVDFVEATLTYNSSGNIYSTTITIDVVGNVSCGSKTKYLGGVNLTGTGNILFLSRPVFVSSSFISGILNNSSSGLIKYVGAGSYSGVCNLGVDLGFSYELDIWDLIFYVDDPYSFILYVPEEE